MEVYSEYDNNGNLIYERHDSGYYEYNKYENGKLVRSEQHYPNGIVEVESYNINSYK